MFFIWYSFYGQSFNVILFPFSRYQTICVIEFLFGQFMTSWTLRFIFDHLLKQWPTVQKRGKGRNTKLWISRERKELYRWNKSIFHSFWRAIIWWKNKNLMKIADTSFKVIIQREGEKPQTSRRTFIGHHKKLPKELTTKFLYLESPTISASCGVKRYMRYIRFLLTKTS